MLQGTAIIISPLLALMSDQIESLAKKNIKATTINSTLGVREKRRVLEELKSR